MYTTIELPTDSNIYQDPSSSNDDNNNNNNNGVKEQKQNRSTTNCKFILSGFGPFGSVKENPTTIIVTKMRSFLQEQQQIQEQQRDDQKVSKYQRLLEMIECVLLETSANNVNETLSKLYTKLVNKTTTTTKTTETTETKIIIILLHLGVDENSTTFKLEKCAYNEATFRIPDQKGYQPTKEKIFHDLELNECITTQLDIEFLHTQMNKMYPSMETKISIDPGRYVCNYVYCNSLQRFGSINDDDGNNNNNSDVCCYSLFLHVPPFTVISEEKQLEYVVSLLEALARSTKQSSVTTKYERKKDSDC
jgi:pyroglutamyl-peptidase